MTQLTNFTVRKDNTILKSFENDIEKAHIKAHMRKTKSGELVNVKEYDDKRQKKNSTDGNEDEKVVKKEGWMKSSKSIPVEKQFREAPVGSTFVVNKETYTKQKNGSWKNGKKNMNYDNLVSEKVTKERHGEKAEIKYPEK